MVNVPAGSRTNIIPVTGSDRRSAGRPASPAATNSPTQRLVAVYTSDFSSGPYGDSSYPDFVSFKTATTAFGPLAAIDDSAPATLRVGDDLQRVRVARVSAEYFPAVGVKATAGRTIGD